MSIEPTPKTREEKLKDHAEKVAYEINTFAGSLPPRILELQAMVMEHPEFSAQEIFTLFGTDAAKIIELTVGLKKVLEKYDPEKYPYVPVDLSGILPQE